MLPFNNAHNKCERRTFIPKSNTVHNNLFVIDAFFGIFRFVTALRKKHQVIILNTKQIFPFMENSLLTVKQTLKPYVLCYWLTDSLTDWLIECVSGWLTDWLTD